jgi:translation initiation factor 1
MATTIRGVPLAAADLDALAGELKRRLGTGGGVHDGVIVIQGDHAEILLGLLREKGYTVKRAGG